MWEKLREIGNSPWAWAAVAVVLGVLSAFVTPALWVVAVIAAFQWGWRSAADVYESGIMCAECGDRLDSEEDPRMGL